MRQISWKTKTFIDLKLPLYFCSLSMNKIEIIKGDITKLKVDAIVNAANSSLMGGGGVDGAIHRAGGSAILEACRKIVAKQGGCKTGEAVITTAGELPAKYVIHTVGPVWNGGDKNEASLLASCYQNSLRLAVDNRILSVAFPNISTGIYGYPKKQAAGIAINTVAECLRQNDVIDKVYFVCFDEENYKLYQSLI
jgi:O-acetyl-ADP-ribose deacetylase (regulator of RNase III)